MIERVESSPAASPPLLERVPPHSAEAEMALLGCLLVDGEMMGAVVPIVRPEDFYRTAHRRLYEVCLAVYERGEPVDPILAFRECERQGCLVDVGGAEYLNTLVSSVAGAGNAEHYARIIREKAVARGVIRVAAELQRAAYEDGSQGDELLELAEHRVFELSRTEDEGQATSIRTLLEGTFQELEHREGTSSGIPTGFFQLDDLTAGLHPGELTIIAGRPSMGKTSFALNVAYNVAVKGRVPTAIFSLEMSRQQITKNILCAHAEVEAHKLRGGRFLTDADYRRLTEAGGPLYEAPLYIDDTPALTTTTLRAKARRLKSRYDIGLVVVDYLQLMDAMGSSKNVDSRQQEISYISRSLKGLARELSVPLVALSQLNRAADSREDHKPRLSDLRECVTGDTPVLLADGRRTPIAGLVDTAPEVLAVAPDGKIVTATSDKVWHVGTRPAFRVTLATGRSITATADHRLRGAEGWLRVRDLRPGSRLAIAANTNVDTLPREMFARVRAGMRSRGISQRKVAALRGTSYGGTSDLRFAPSRALLSDYARLLEDSTLAAEAASDLFWDRVVSVEATGEQEVYDLTVPGPSCWLADGIVSHNSGAIEQDADVICFLYRKHYYTKSESDRGLAEVIVAKQRNGPTDTVRLAFMDSYMRFDNLAPGGAPGGGAP